MPSASHAETDNSQPMTYWRLSEAMLGRLGAQLVMQRGSTPRWRPSCSGLGMSGRRRRAARGTASGRVRAVIGGLRPRRAAPAAAWRAGPLLYSRASSGPGPWRRWSLGPTYAGSPTGTSRACSRRPGWASSPGVRRAGSAESLRTSGPCGPKVPRPCQRTVTGPQRSCLPSARSPFARPQRPARRGAPHPSPRSRTPSRRERR
jgi:hypothetical protein